MLSGELILEKSGGKSRFLALLITAAVILAITTPMTRMLTVRAGGGIMSQLGIAILVPMLIWLVHPQVMKLLPGGRESTETLRWRIQDDALVLGEAVIPLRSIKMVHCWQKNDRWTINIETTGKNHLLRSVAEGEAADRSVRRLYALVDALGYRSQWREV